MCLILFSYRPDSNRPLVVAANRDEIHERASQAAMFWGDAPTILAGRDLVAGGTWLGCNREGRFAALTNFSGEGDPVTPKSRGALVHDFLSSELTAMDYINKIIGAEYAGYNLLLWDRQSLVYTSNKAPTQVLNAGEYGLSNAELGAPWPKCINGKNNLAGIISKNFDENDLIDLLSDEFIAEDQSLPRRGKPLEMERKIAPCFIKDPVYGTRASTVLILEDKSLKFTEQSYLPNGIKSTRQSYTLDIG